MLQFEWYNFGLRQPDRGQSGIVLSPCRSNRISIFVSMIMHTPMVQFYQCHLGVRQSGGGQSGMLRRRVSTSSDVDILLNCCTDRGIISATLFWKTTLVAAWHRFVAVSTASDLEIFRNYCSDRWRNFSGVSLVN